MTFDGNKWKLLNGSVTLITQESNFPLTTNFKEKTIVMEEDSKDLTSTGKTSDLLTMKELSYFIKKNKDAGLDTTRYEMDYHSKFGFAVSALVMTLLGIPFSVARARAGGFMRNIGIVLGLVTGYWVFFSSAQTLGNFGRIPPILAAWGPNLIMLTAAVFMLRPSKRA